MKEIIKNILKEALFTQHLGERFYSRFLNMHILRNANNLVIVPASPLPLLYHRPSLLDS